VRHFAVECNRFDTTVRLEQNRAARGFVAATALHADVAVFNQIQTTNAVLAADLVQFSQEFVRLHGLAVDGNQIALHEFQIEVFRGIRCGFRADGPAPHGFFGFSFRVFEVTAFVADVQEVGVHRVRRAAVLVLHVDFNASGFGVGHQLFTRVQIPFAPRGDDLHARHQRVSA